MIERAPPSEQPAATGKRPTMPRAVRIMPPRTAWRAALAAGLASTTIFGWIAPHTQSAVALCWIALGGSLLVVIGSGLRLLLQLPLIEASELGIAIWIRGPYRRPFFVPWSRVQSIGLTRVRSAQGTTQRDALGIELTQDDPSHPRVPAVRGELPIDGAAPADLAWSSRSISGDLRYWVKLLQQMRSAYAESPE